MMSPATPPDPAADQLYGRIAQILKQARGQVARTVNTAMVHSDWHIGREIVEVEQAGAAGAGYGEEVSGADAAGHIHQTPSGESLPRAPGPMFPPALGWTHDLVLMRVTRPEARAFYEIEAAHECWSTRQLERQIGALLFDRLAPEDVLALARQGQEVATSADVLKESFVLEFLDLPEHPALRERDIEQAIIGRLEAFMLKLGKGFCFVGRQQRLAVDGDHFYVDLVFYNRLLRCFVLVDLKLGKRTHQDLGQMQMYVNYFDRTQRAEHEHKTIGIVLRSEQNAAMVKITRARHGAERALRLAAAGGAP